MLKETVFDLIDKRTLRPNAKPLWKKGDMFYYINLPDFSWEITFLKEAFADDLITLFIIYYSFEIIDLIIKKTN
jgi:hypothetical protein